MDTHTAQDSINKKCAYHKQIKGYVLVWLYMHNIWIIIVMRTLFQGNFLILLVELKVTLPIFNQEGSHAELLSLNRKCLVCSKVNFYCCISRQVIIYTMFCANTLKWKAKYIPFSKIYTSLGLRYWILSELREKSKWALILVLFVTKCFITITMILTI